MHIGLCVERSPVSSSKGLRPLGTLLPRAPRDGAASALKLPGASRVAYEEWPYGRDP